MVTNTKQQQWTELKGRPITNAVRAALRLRPVAVLMTNKEVSKAGEIRFQRQNWQIGMKV